MFRYSSPIAHRVGEDVSLVRTEGRLVLKRSVVVVRDSGGGKRR